MDAVELASFGGKAVTLIFSLFFNTAFLDIFLSGNSFSLENFFKDTFSSSSDSQISFTATEKLENLFCLEELRALGDTAF